MNLRALPALFLTTTIACWGGAPDKLDGFIYYEYGTYSFPMPRPRFEESASVFASDGTFSQIYFRRNPGASLDLNSPLQTPGSGSFSYKKIDDKTAALAFANSAFSHSGIMQFDSSSGETGVLFDPARDPNIIDLSSPARRSFRLVSLSALSPLVNSSNRSFVRSGSASFAGFVISGTTNRVVVVRAIGPGLAQFGITDFLKDPELRVNGIVRNDNWSSEDATSIRRTSAAVGAFALPEGSKDAVAILNLAPGAYVAQASSSDPADSGQVLLEVYMLP